MEESTALLFGAIIYLTGSLSIIGLGFYYNSKDIDTKNTVCKTLDLGKYIINSANYKEIDGQKYFKCTKDTYNSTTKEIITSEKWVKLP